MIIIPFMTLKISSQVNSSTFEADICRTLILGEMRIRKDRTPVSISLEESMHFSHDCAVVETCDYSTKNFLI